MPAQGGSSGDRRPVPHPCPNERAQIVTRNSFTGGTATNIVDETTPLPPTQGWRVVDIVVAAVLGVAVGLIFFGWNSPGYAWFQALDALTPGLGGLAAGIWFIGGPLGGLIIRKPGAAIFVELVGAAVSALLGNAWGVSTLFSGLAQGVFAELVFWGFRYRKFTLPVALLAGAGGGVGAWFGELWYAGNIALTWQFNVIYLVCCVISGIVLAGLSGWLLTRALARTGVLNRFAAGRES